MNVVIIVLGVVGLAAAGFFLGELVLDAARRRHYTDVVVALALVVGSVWLLFAYGDTFLQ